jgi:hypothetical protein
MKKYEVIRFWDAPMNYGHGSVGLITRDNLIKIGDEINPLDNEYKDGLQKELLTGVVNGIISSDECQNIKLPFDFRIGLERKVNLTDLAKRYGKNEDNILTSYFDMYSEMRNEILTKNSGTLLLDDSYSTLDIGNVGVIWFSGGDLLIYRDNPKEVLRKESPGLGLRYGSCGKRDFLTAIGRVKERLKLEDIYSAVNSIKDYDYYHWEDD